MEKSLKMCYKGVNIKHTNWENVASVKASWENEEKNIWQYLI